MCISNNKLDLLWHWNPMKLKDPNLVSPFLQFYMWRWFNFIAIIVKNALDYFYKKLPFPQTVMEPLESPVMTSPLGENSKHVKYWGISYFCNGKHDKNLMWRKTFFISFLSSVCIFSILLSLHFPRCQLGEFV